MEILNKDISKLNYKELKEMVSVIDIKQLLHSEELERVITKLAKDSRKNVNALGVKLQKDIKKLLTDSSIKQIDLMNKYNISRNTLKKYIEYIANKKCI